MEVNVAARQGDSGGPIFNARGELAGVLFGSNDSFLTGQYTMGSYCGRVRLFVASVSSDFQRLPDNPAMVARQGQPMASGVAGGFGHARARSAEIQPAASLSAGPGGGQSPGRADAGGTRVRRGPACGGDADAASDHAAAVGQPG